MQEITYSSCYNLKYEPNYSNVIQIKTNLYHRLREVWKHDAITVDFSKETVKSRMFVIERSESRMLKNINK